MSTRAYRLREKRDRQSMVLNRKRKGCARCGKRVAHHLLAFHHRDPATKSMTVATAVTRGGRSAFEAELSKCDALCPACHAGVHGIEIPLARRVISITALPVVVDGRVVFTLAWPLHAA